MNHQRQFRRDLRTLREQPKVTLFVFAVFIAIVALALWGAG